MQYTTSDAKAWAREKLLGQWTTMVTPFTPDDQLDEKGLAANIEHVLRLGTKGMGFSWNMGEFWSLAPAERLRLMELVPELVRGRSRIAFQITATSLKEVVALGHRAEELGFDFVILGPPFIVTKTEEQVLDFTERVASQLGIGIAFYNSPQFGITLSARALSKMADLRSLIAIKEASFNLQLSIDTHLQAGGKAVVSVPDEEIFFFEEYYGFHQQVMFANTSDWRFDSPESHSYVDFVELATGGRLEEAKRRYRSELWPIKSLSRRWWTRLVARTGGSLPVQMVKYWGELMGMAGGHVRPPLLPMTPEEKTELRQELSRLRPVKALAAAPAAR